jgi:hypothetical protein
MTAENSCSSLKTSSLHSHSRIVDHFDCSEIFYSCVLLREMLAPICEISEHASGEKYEDTDLSEQSKASSIILVGEQSSLSETFTWLNRDFSCFNSKKKPSRSSREHVKLATGESVRHSTSTSDSLIRKEQPVATSFEQQILSLTIDFLPCLIAIILAIALFLSTR